jgi:hypothetical protein
MMLSNDRKGNVRLQQLLAKLTELKDEKIQLSQTLHTHIERKYKTVNDAFQNDIQIKQERSPTPARTTISNLPQSSTIVPTIIVKQSSVSNASSATNSASESQEKNVKRARKVRIDNLETDSIDDNFVAQEKPISTISTTQVVASKRVANTTAAGTSSIATNKKAKKKKTTVKKQVTAQDSIDEILADDDGVNDETVYCICQQISYGEMIFCENDTCPIEWFHFSCVDLTSKPKGRWYCPDCRIFFQKKKPFKSKLKNSKKENNK